MKTIRILSYSNFICSCGNSGKEPPKSENNLLKLKIGYNVYTPYSFINESGDCNGIAIIRLCSFAFMYIYFACASVKP